MALHDGRFGAALVLGANEGNVELGMNLIATLNYCNEAAPALSVFDRRDWLSLYHVFTDTYSGGEIFGAHSERSTLR